MPAEVRRELAGFLPKSADTRQIEEALARCTDGGSYFATERSGAAAPAARYQPVR